MWHVDEEETQRISNGVAMYLLLLLLLLLQFLLLLQLSLELVTTISAAYMLN